MAQKKDVFYEEQRKNGVAVSASQSKGFASGMPDALYFKARDAQADLEDVHSESRFAARALIADGLHRTFVKWKMHNRSNHLVSRHSLSAVPPNGSERKRLRMPEAPRHRLWHARLDYVTR